MKTKNTPRSGFTLIELLTVIAIIGILAAILIPAVGKVREVANKSKSSSNMRSIAVSYATYSTSGGRVRTLTQARMTADADVTLNNVAGVAQFLAKQSDLTDASIWIIESDPAVAAYAGLLPAIVGFRDEANAFQTAEDWVQAVPVGYDFAIGVSGNAPTSTTPLLWTRALTTSGTWGPDSPWGLGGHIAYLDGHVSFYTELGTEDGQLVDPSNGNLTVNIQDIHTSANIMLAPAFSRQ
ncbi:MAG: prepilin-type N-terminal cleavage/methylation domain-containing protein [Puniceicoccaceae bacterium]|nr:MAG: prepilin-type N-terminal cleavage/methylation domain-containing protein [Puniceicoccaceae bacterium]